MSVDVDVRKAYLGLDDSDLEALAELKPALEETADEFTAAFYRHLLSFAEPRQLLADPVVRDRLLESQKHYYISLADPELGVDYVEQRLRIGHVHERIGLSASWYIGAYSIYVREIGHVIERICAGDAARERRLLGAVCRRLLLDMELAMEAYIDKRQAQLEFLNRELADAQLGLSREVHEQRAELRETTARARAAEQLASVGVLAAGLAHEIGTPMGVIRGHAESLEGAVSDERSLWRVRTIVEQIDRITNIMQALLNLARPREPVIAPVTLGEVVETAVSFLHEKLARRGIEVELKLDSNWVVQGDVEKLQQLFLNLILNAADAMPDGGSLQLALQPGVDDHVVASVVDTGVGIEPDQLPKVFDPFFTTKQAGQGNGLGLVVARGIAIDHGGDIEVLSEVGRGTEFRVQPARDHGCRCRIRLRAREAPLDAAPRPPRHHVKACVRMSRSRCRPPAEGGAGRA